MLQALGLQRAAEGEDPRRVFRELGSNIVQVATALGTLTWRWALLWAQDGQEWLRSKLAGAR